MKRLILIGGTMGVGKTATARELGELLPRNVMLDGNWCWQAKPFVVTDETRAMVMDNITHLLGNFLRCGAYENVIFCWVMHEQSILDELLARLHLDGVKVHSFSLVCSEEALQRRLSADIDAGVRDADVLARSLPRLALYAALDTEKIDTTFLSADEAAQEIARRVME